MTLFEELELPKTSVIRIVKSQPSSKGILLQKDVKDALSKSATLFVSYLTATVHDLVTQRYQPGLPSQSHGKNRSNRSGGGVGGSGLIPGQSQKINSKSIQVHHIYKALEILEFESFIPILKRHLEAYQEARKLKFICQPNAAVSQDDEEEEEVAANEPSPIDKSGLEQEIEEKEDDDEDE